MEIKFKRPYDKSSRRVANTNSNGTIKAQKLLRRLEKEKDNGAAQNKEK